MVDHARQIEKTIELVARMIPRERHAKQVYSRASGSAPTEMMRILFEHLAIQAGQHQSKLEAVLRMLREQFRQTKDKAVSGP